jgi:hypothetical protein
MKDRPHDPLVCGLDYKTDCDDCRARLVRLRRLEHLEERLTKAGIYPDELAEILWMHLERHIEERLEKVFDERLRAVMRRLSFRWNIEPRDEIYKNNGVARGSEE